MVIKEDLPNNSEFGKVLSEIWALEVLLKQPKLAARPIKNLLPHLKFKTYVVNGGKHQSSTCLPSSEVQ